MLINLIYNYWADPIKIRNVHSVMYNDVNQFDIGVGISPSQSRPANPRREPTSNGVILVQFINEGRLEIPILEKTALELELLVQSIVEKINTTLAGGNCGEEQGRNTQP